MYLACALAQAAIRRGHRALYWRVPRLLHELRVAHADGRAAQLMASWARIDVLVLDDLGLRPLTPAQAGDLLEVIEARHQRRLTILTSRLRSSAGPALADYIELDGFAAHLTEVAVWTNMAGAWSEHGTFLLRSIDGRWHAIGFSEPAATELLEHLTGLPGFDTDPLRKSRRAQPASRHVLAYPQC
jgi:hypothetical protein